MRLVLVLVLFVFACGDDVAPPDEPIEDAGEVIQDGGSEEDPVDDDYDAGPRPVYPRSTRECWVECYLNPCLLKCGEGMVPTKTVGINVWQCSEDVGQCDEYDLDGGT